MHRRASQCKAAHGIAEQPSSPFSRGGWLAHSESNARHHMTRHCTAWRGTARHRTARQSSPLASSQEGVSWLPLEVKCKAKPAMARQGIARQNKAMHRIASQCSARHHMASQRMAAQSSPPAPSHEGVGWLPLEVKCKAAHSNAEQCIAWHRSAEQSLIAFERGR
jgi:hypothetical protein